MKSYLRIMFFYDVFFSFYINDDKLCNAVECSLNVMMQDCGIKAIKYQRTSIINREFALGDLATKKTRSFTFAIGKLDEKVLEDFFFSFLSRLFFSRKQVKIM